MTRIKQLLAFTFLSVAVSACSLFPPQGEDGHFIRKDVKDISTQARKEDAAPRKRLMLLPFLDASKDRPQSLRDNAKVEFIKELNLKSDMIVIDSSDLKVDFKNTLENGEYNLKEVARQGQSLGVLALLEGKIIDIRIKRKSDEVGVIRQMKSMFEVLVRVRLVATRSGSELLNVTKTVVLEDSQVRVAEDVSSDRLVKAAPHVVENLVKEAFLDFVPQIKLALEKLNWEGRVAMINGDRIFLNVGRQSGLQMGDILKVVDDGEDVFDPQTGVWIGKVPGRLKGTLEVVSYFGQDGAVTVIHSGAGFKENDKVELY